METDRYRRSAHMSYKTTKIQPIKSYPTFQFHAFTASKCDTDTVFKICVLETLRWLRGRFDKFDKLPEQLIAPDPADHASYSEDKMCSFNLNLGATLDCTYIHDRGIWSIRITELDIGENPGQDNERPPVNGRSFRTEISFLKSGRNVEAGVRTVCSEPADCDVGCTVFRPALIKALANNPDVGFINEGFRIDGTPLIVKNKSDFRNLEKLISSSVFDMPTVLVADGVYATETASGKPAAVGLRDAFAPVGITGTLQKGRFFDEDMSKNAGGSAVILPALSYSEEASADLENRRAVVISLKRPSGKKSGKVSSSVRKSDKANELLPSFDYATLAAKQVGFSVVCFIDEKCFELIRNVFGITFDRGDIVTCVHGKEILRRRFTKDKTPEFTDTVNAELTELMKRRMYTFGGVMFYSDARIAELEGQHNKNSSLEDELDLYKNENTELNNKIRDLTQHNTDMQRTAEVNRQLSKDLSDANDRISEQSDIIEKLLAEADHKEKAYRDAAELKEFYIKKTADAAHFPTEKESVCKWASEQFSKNLIIATQAAASLKRYNKPFDVADLCDALYYLNAYAEYRLGNIDEDRLTLYNGSCNWKVCSCGKKTLEDFNDDYTTIYEGKKYLLDIHVKSGSGSEDLVRVYFCWDDKLKKVIIGHMPGHLPTVSRRT